MNNSLLNNIAVDLVKDKVMDDKMKEYEEEALKEQEDINKETNKNKNKNEKEEKDLDDIDSEEERIMKKEMEKLKEKQDVYIEKEKKKLAQKYGDYKEILETEFLDIMLKNENVICHFYHNEFERCKIMDKHLKEISQLHPESLFVKINAEKTPFFTEKLNIKVIFKLK